MKRMLVSNWDMFLVRGILAILFGIATLLMPGITLVVLVALFGAYALVDGIFLSIIAIKDRKNRSRLVADAARGSGQHRGWHCDLGLAGDHRR